MPRIKKQVSRFSVVGVLLTNRMFAITYGLPNCKQGISGFKFIVA